MPATSISQDEPLLKFSFGFFFPIFAIWLKMWTVDMDGDRKQVIYGMCCEMKMSKGRKSRRPSYENKFHMKAWQQMLDKPGGFPMCYVGMASPFLDDDKAFSFDIEDAAQCDKLVLSVKLSPFSFLFTASFYLL